MRKTLLVMRRELAATFGRRVYVVVAFAVPLLAVLVVTAAGLVRGTPTGGAPAGAPAEMHLAIEGFVDRSGLVQVIPDNLPAGHLLAFENEEHARQALEAGQITAYYVVPPDYVRTGNLYYVYPDTRSYLADGQEWVMAWTLTVNLLGGDMGLADRVWNPIRELAQARVVPEAPAQAVSGDDCSRPGAACKSNDLVRFMPLMMVLVLYAALMINSSMLFGSVSGEKENRTVEVLMLSVSPGQLLAGKTLGLGLAGLLQTAAWLGAVFVVFNAGGAALALPAGFTFPADIVTWGLVFFFGGYALYAGMMAGAGALAPGVKEVGAVNMIVAMPLFCGYMVGLVAPISGAQDAALPVALSLFPLTAPVVMMMRLTGGDVPLWQLLLSAGLVFAAAYVSLRVTAAMFHAQNLLSGEPFSAGRYARALLGRA